MTARRKNWALVEATAQPTWEFVANLGDASPLDYDGMFLYHDTSRNGFELEKLAAEDDKRRRWTVYRVCLDRLQEDGKDRAWAYQCIYDFHGWGNGDSYPLRLTRKDVLARYKRGEI